jgi:hypothetical protein
LSDTPLSLTRTELENLIEEIATAANEAIEQAAGEAAKAVVIASIEREAAAYREASLQQAEALRWRMQAENNLQVLKSAKKAGRKNVILGVAHGIIGGLVVGVGGTMLINK